MTKAYLLNPFDFEICDLWTMGAADPIEDTPVESDIPALIFAGYYDPITSPERPQRAAETLSVSYYYEFPNMAHGVIRTDECALHIGLQFLEDPRTEPVTACMDEIDHPSFK